MFECQQLLLLFPINIPHFIYLIHVVGKSSFIRTVAAAELAGQGGAHISVFYIHDKDMGEKSGKPEGPVQVSGNQQGVKEGRKMGRIGGKG